MGDLGRVLCPPYDVISAEERLELIERDAHNAVRLELPGRGDDPQEGDDRYRTAAVTLRDWRTDGTLLQDLEPHLYIHEMRFAEVGGRRRAARGVICRLRLEPLGPSGSIRPHERTMAGPKEDRFRLLAATGTDLSPVVMIHERRGTGDLLERLTAVEPDVRTTDGAGIRHSLWVIGMEHEAAHALLEVVGAGPLTIADGHHRYETALRYQHECADVRTEAGLAPADTVMALVYAIEEAPTVLATHRVVRDLPADLLDRASEMFGVRRIDDEGRLLRSMAQPRAPGVVRIGCWRRGGGALLTRQRDVDDLDTAILAEALWKLAEISEEEMRAGRRIAYTTDQLEAIDMVERGEGDAAFLLEPTPMEAVLQVAERGGIMPQKSTYFHPKAPTGLVFDPLDT